jgi:hypothetical protein
MVEEIWIVKTFVILQKRVKPITETALRMPEHLAYCNSNTKATCNVPHIWSMEYGQRNMTACTSRCWFTMQ